VGVANEDSALIAEWGGYTGPTPEVREKMKIIFLAMLFVACSTTAQKPGLGDKPEVSDTAVSTVDTGALFLDTGEAPGTDTGTAEPLNIDMAVVIREDCVVCADLSVTLKSASALTVLMGPVGEAMRPWVYSESSATHSIPLLELRPDTDYALMLELDIEGSPVSIVKAFSTLPLPDDFPIINVNVSTPDGTEPGITLMVLIERRDEIAPDVDGTGNLLVALDAQGRVVWYDRIYGMALALHIDDLSRIYTTQTVLRVLKLDPYAGTEEIFPATSMGLDTVHHDVRSLADGGMAMLSSEHTEVRGEWGLDGVGMVTHDIISDVLTTVNADGEVTWSWSLIDHFDPLDHFTGAMNNPFWAMMAPYNSMANPKDWSHGNAMVPNDGGWLLSLRNLDWVMQVNPSTDEVDWVFGYRGDFTLAEGSIWFGRQHDPKILENGNLLMYDNGLHRPERPPGSAPYSRVVEYNLNFETMVASEVWSWDGGAQVVSLRGGNVERLGGGNYLVNDGSLYEPMVSEGGERLAHYVGRVRQVANIQTEPEVLWEITVGTWGDYEGRSWCVYKAVHIPSLYPDSARPR